MPVPLRASAAGVPASLVARPIGHDTITGATASTAARDTTGFRSSGQSPGLSPGAARATVHVLGTGAVARALLRRLAHEPVTVVAVSDAEATVFDRGGLSLDAVSAHLVCSAPLAVLPRAERLAPELALSFVAADVVVFAGGTALGHLEGAIERGRSVLRRGASLVLAEASVLAAAAGEWLLGLHRERVGADAALGGIGHRLAGELAELRADCRSVAFAGDPWSTAFVQAVEAGIAPADARALAFGAEAVEVTAPARLAAIRAAVFGAEWSRDAAPRPFVRDELPEPPSELLRARARRGATTRLVARVSRGGGDLQVGFEEVPRGTPLAAPPDRVVAVYELPAGQRVHTGIAVTVEGHAEALLGDLRLLAGKEVRT